jgi:hypothetical protein
MKFMLEEYCDECDMVVHQVVDDKDFLDGKIGGIKCPVCGSVVMPCNACYDEDKNCDYCPFKTATPIEAMTDEDHIRWYKENDNKIFEMMKNGELGEFYKEIALTLD